MIRIDNKLLVLEFKSHTITDSARRGYEPRIKKHLDEIIIHPYKQAMRCIEYIVKNDNVDFKDANGNIFTFNSKELDDIIPVSITLAQLGHITAGLKNADDSTFFRDVNYSWAVNIYDLKIICDLLRNSAELFDYISERAIFMKDQRTMTYDELDIFSYYLSRQLNSVSKVQQDEEYSWGYLSNATDEINHYYFNQYGDYFKESIDRPSFKIPQKIIPVIDKILDSKLRNRIDACIHIFSMDLKSISMYAKRLSIIRKSNKKSNHHHDFTVASTDIDGLNIGITVVIDSNVERLVEVCKYLKAKRLSDPKIKKGFIIKLKSEINNYSIVEIEKYATNTAATTTRH